MGNHDQISWLSDQLEQLAHENRELQRRNRRIIRVALLAVALVFVLAIGGSRFAENPRIVDAERFQITDRGGKVRASIGLNRHPRGEAVELLLKDQGQRDRLRLVVDPDGLANIGFFDPPEMQRMTLSMAPNGPIGFSIHDIQGRECVTIGAKNGTVSVSLLRYTDQETLHLFLGITERGSSRIAVDRLDAIQTRTLLERGVAPGAKSVFRFGLGTDNSTRLDMMDTKGKNRLEFFVLPDGQAGFAVRDASETYRLSAGVSTLGSPRMFFFDKEGKANMQVP